VLPEELRWGVAKVVCSTVFHLYLESSGFLVFFVVKSFELFDVACHFFLLAFLALFPRIAILAMCGYRRAISEINLDHAQLRRDRGSAGLKGG
jgi:hypothetical protein